MSSERSRQVLKVRRRTWRDEIPLLLPRIRPAYRHRWAIYQALASLLDRRMAIADALDAIAEAMAADGRRASHPLIAVPTRWSRAMKGGRSFVDAIQGDVPGNELTLIGAVLHGRSDDAALPAMLRRIVADSRNRSQAYRDFFAGLAWPAVLTVMLIANLAMIAERVGPLFARIISQGKLQGGAVVVLTAAEWLREWWPVIPPALTTGIFALLFALKYWTGRGRATADRYWPFSSYKTWQAADFMLSLGALLAAGRGLQEALQAIDATAGPYLRSRVRALLAHGATRNLGEAAARTGHAFPDPLTIAMLRIYARGHGLSTQLEQMAADAAQAATQRLKAQAAVTGTACHLLILAVIIGTSLAFASINTQLGQSFTSAQRYYPSEISK